MSRRKEGLENFVKQPMNFVGFHLRFRMTFKTKIEKQNKQINGCQAGKIIAQ